jgi:hypothetical protein
MARLGSFCWWLLIARACASTVVSRFVQGPSIRETSSCGVLCLLLVTLAGLSLVAVLQAVTVGSRFALTNVCGLGVDLAFGSTFHAPVLQLVRQAVAVLWVVANDVLPFVAGIACDRVAVIFVEAAYAVYLAVVLLLQVVRVLLISKGGVLWRRTGNTRGEWLDVWTGDSGGPKEVCHAITSAFEVVVGGDRFR